MFQVERPPPPIPERVWYESLDEVRRDASALVVPWVHLNKSEGHVCVGKLHDSKFLYTKIDISADFTADVFIRGNVLLFL